MAAPSGQAAPSGSSGASNSGPGTGKEGRVTKEDLINHMEGHSVAKVRSTPAVRAFAK